MANFVPAGYEDEYSDDSDDFAFNYYNNKRSTNKSSIVVPDAGDVSQNWESYDDWNNQTVNPNENWETGDDWNTDQMYDKNETFPPVDLSSKLQNNVKLPIDDLRIAILNGDLETTRQYINSGVDVDIILKSNWTPLMYASNAGHPEIVEYLLERGANVNYNKAEMFTPLMAACMSNNKEHNVVQCIVHLVKHGASVNSIDRFHSTALMHAANSGHLLALQKLLEYEADPNLVDTHGWTALFYAANSGYMSLVTELKKVGVNIKHRDNRKDSAADIAYSRTFDQIAAFLDDIYKETNDKLSATENIESDPCMERTEMLERYGELELFLHGLELGSFIELFHRHQVSFHQLLQLTDSDLEKIGVMKVGARKKIVDAIKAVHKKDWQTTSLMKIQYDTSIRCSDAAAMLANISRHTLYITSTIGYIGDQVRLHPEIITETYDTKLLKQLLHYMQEAKQNTSKLVTQLDNFDHSIKILTEKKNLEPINHITESSIVKKRQYFPFLIPQTQHKLLMTMTVALMGLMIWKKNIVIDKFILFSDRIQHWFHFK